MDDVAADVVWAGLQRLDVWYVVGVEVVSGIGGDLRVVVVFEIDCAIDRQDDERQRGDV